MHITPVIDSVLLLTLLHVEAVVIGCCWLVLTLSKDSAYKCTKMRHLHLQNKKNLERGTAPPQIPHHWGEEIPSLDPPPDLAPPMKISGYALAFHSFVCCLHEVAVTYSIGSNNYGRPLSVSGRPCYNYFANVFFIFFYGRLILRPWLTEVRESFTRGGPWVALEKLLLGFFPGHP